MKRPSTARNKTVLLGLVSLLITAGITVLLSRPPHPSTGDATTKLDETWVEQWQSAPSFQYPRRALSAAATDSHLYVVGGINDNDEYVATVEFAPLHSDGTLGPWQNTSALIEGRFYLASVIVGDYIYAIGGATGPRGEDNIPSAGVEKARIFPDGRLGVWERERYLSTPRRGLQAAAFNNTLYAVGGYNGQFLRSTERAAISAAGHISQWIVENHLSSADRYIHAATAYNNRLFLLAGHVDNAPIMSYADVEAARILPSGELSEWEPQPARINQPRFIAAAATVDNTLYLIGGHSGGKRLASVEFAKVLPNGKVGAWRQSTPLSAPRSSPAALAHGDYLYVLGGATTDGATNTVEFARARHDGHVGMLAPATQQ